MSSFNYCLACKFNNPGDYCAPNYAYESNYGRYTWADLYGAGKDTGVDNERLSEVTKAIRQHPTEIIGAWLRERMTGMAKIAVATK